MSTESTNSRRGLPAVVVFDLGKVLVDFDYALVAQRVAAKSGLTPSETVRIETTPLLVAYETGRLTSAEFFQAVRDRTGYSGSLAEFAVDFGDIFSPIEEMIAFQSALRENGVPTFIFSNTNELAIRHIRRRFLFFGDFDAHVLSYEVGCMKPEAAIYAEVERISGRQGEQILYLDDRPENVAAGAARGWRVIEHRTPEETLSSEIVRSLLTQS